jgi:kynurenine formamidase
MKRFVELSHPLQDGMQAYPGLPTPKIGALFTHEESRSRYDGQAEFYIGKVDLACNVGTYLDSPFHRYRDAPDLSQIPLKDVAGLQGIVLDGSASPNRTVTLDSPEADLKGRAVLVKTGGGTRVGEPRATGNPVLFSPRSRLTCWSARGPSW